MVQQSPGGLEAIFNYIGTTQYSQVFLFVNVDSGKVHSTINIGSEGLYATFCINNNINRQDELRGMITDRMERVEETGPAWKRVQVFPIYRMSLTTLGFKSIPLYSIVGLKSKLIALS